MSMRRFFRAHRDEDYSQIQYLTAKCTRLAHDKVVLDREFLMCRERERKLQVELEATNVRLLQQEQVNVELRMKQGQLVGRIHQQQDLVNSLQQRVVLLVEESSWDAELLQQVGAELLCLQRSEMKLEGLVEGLHAEAERRAEVAESLQAELRTEAQRRIELTESLQEELRSKTAEVQELQDLNKTLTEELKDSCNAHRKEVRELQQVNEGSLKKLQETAEQFEWLCHQQRNWMCCVKRFKDCLMEEREALVQQVRRLEKEAEKLRTRSGDDDRTQSLLRRLQDGELRDGTTSWGVDAVSEVEKSDPLYEQLITQVGSPINGHQKPP
ncbi:early endosome antigen 1 isoform X2 [Echeneis naucrates]|uniref:early endosome antigen 1 isoform X2 n=1 Tax=Echeneis naucrates TaxID=173247 RepID=UPI00111405DA|nr:early endosome antigen 1-like isoform X2 [Echeneis naucrates]